MERLIRFVIILAIPIVIFTSCGATPIFVDLDDFSINIPAAVNTAGLVIYSADPISLEKQSLNIKAVRLSGFIEPTYTGDTLKLTFYASATEPDGCASFQSILICGKIGHKRISSEYTLHNGFKQPISLGDPNADVLADGVNNGKLWIGVEVTSSASADISLQFSDMVASVTIF